MNDPTVTCPTCQANIRLTESLAAPLINAARQQLEAEFLRKENDLDKREVWLIEQQNILTNEKKSMDELINEKLHEQRKLVIADESEKARLSVAIDLAKKNDEVSYWQSVAKQRDEKLAQSQKIEVELLRKQQALDDAIREQELTIERQVQESLSGVREQAKQAAEDGLKLKILEKEQLIGAMQKQIDELKRKSEQGSQQLQGEVQELNLESILKSKFIRDTIEPVAKGEFGGDIVQKVFGPSDQLCGSILWESKRTKNWSDNWLPKLREDSRSVQADIAIIVSQAMPKQVETFDYIDGIWITTPKYVLPVAMLLRQSLIEIAAMRQSNHGRETKMEMLYEYLIGPRFRHRVEAIVEKFTDMQSELQKERSTMYRIWAKREQQIQCVVEATAGMYGDLQGIAGRMFQEIEGLEMKFIETDNVSSELQVTT